MTAPVRLAFVGSTDLVSPWLLRAMSRVGAQFVGLCESNEERAERAAADFHARWPFHGILTMLADAQPHGIVLGAGSIAPEEVLRRSLGEGVSVLALGMPIERRKNWNVRGKAFAWSAAAVRYAPAGLLCRRLLESGKVSEPQGASLSVSVPRVNSQSATERGPVDANRIFDAVDWIEHLCGPTREVFARGHPGGSIAATLVTHDDVPIALTLHEHGTHDSAGMTLELRAADAACLRMERDMSVVCRHGSRVVASYATTPGVSDPSVESGYCGLLREFIRRIIECRAADTAAEAESHAARTTRAVLSALTRSGAVRVS